MAKDNLREEQTFLQQYDVSEYERPSVTVDIAVCTIMEEELRVLLIKRGGPPDKGAWALPGGFLSVKSDRSLEAAARRELIEETHIEGVFFDQLKTYGAIDRDPRTRVVTVVYYALVPFEKLRRQDIRADDDAAEVAWFPLRDLPKKLAFDHEEILADVLERLIGKIEYYPLAFELLPKTFIWPELQNIYEVILDRKFDPSNFRKKINSLYTITELRKKKDVPIPGPKPSYLIYEGPKKMFQDI